MHKESGRSTNDGIGAGKSHSLRFSMRTQVFAHLFTSMSSLLMCDVKTVRVCKSVKPGKYVPGYSNGKINTGCIHV